MCGRYRLARDERALAEHFELEEWREIRIPPHLPRFNVAPSQSVPAVRLRPDGQRELVDLRWGLVPAWSQAPETAYRTINARAETVAEKPTFRGPFRRRRCLVPSDGFYEWQPVGKRKQPWLIRLGTGGLFAFAGLWDRWEGADGTVLESCAVIVTSANELVAPIHDRMPVILDPADYGLWLDVGRFDRDRLQSLLAPFPADRMEAFRVSTLVNSPSNDDERVSAPSD